MTRRVSIGAVDCKPTLFTRNLILQMSCAYAFDFFHASQKTRSGPVKTFLLGHALELYLKAFLLSKGFRHSELKNKYGHHLNRLLSTADKAGLHTLLRISPELSEAVDSFSAIYSKKRFEYFEPLPELFIPWKDDLTKVSRFTKRLSELDLKIT